MDEYKIYSNPSFWTITILLQYTYLNTLFNKHEQQNIQKYYALNQKVSKLNMFWQVACHCQ